MSDKKEIEIGKNIIYEGKIIGVTVSDVICPNGHKSKREVVHHPGGVTVLAEYEGKIVMEKQYRFPFDDFIFELPAGKLEKGEDPYEAGIRELEEETGLKAEKLLDFGKIYPSVGYTDEIIYLYVAENCKKTQQHLDENEDLDLCFYSVEELEDMLNKNLIVDAKTVALLYKYIRYKKEGK